MTHFAEITDNLVTTVIVAEQGFVDSQPGTWVQTSYNTRGGVHYAPDSNTPDGGVALHKNYAGIGYTYVNGVGFHAPQPYPSWTLDSDTYLWEPPVSYPDDGKRYAWNEDTTAWVEVED
jgi:hypothetical protein